MDNTLIYQVCFDVIGSNGQASTFNFVGQPTLIQVVSNNGNALQPSIFDGSVEVSNSSNCTHPDKPALIALYEATGGDNWTPGNTWDTTTCNVCDWYGIECDGNNRVIGIDLDGVDDGFLTNATTPGNNLVGFLPVLYLPELRYLGLYHNNLSTAPLQFPIPQKF
ncbi:MAG: hypothetical protein IPN76_26075 [Saprospiraceae bacterium]|nr:hypothetical protein [Saprospiraceae bacterium]